MFTHQRVPFLLAETQQGTPEGEIVLILNINLTSFLVDIHKFGFFLTKKPRSRATCFRPSDSREFVAEIRSRNVRAARVHS